MLDTAKFDWNDDAIALLSKLWGEGKSASECAALLGGGVSRSAVIGKVHRLKLAKRSRDVTASAPRRKPARVPSRPKPAPKPASNIHAAPDGKHSHSGLAFRIAQARKDVLAGAEGMEAVLGRDSVPLEEVVEEGIDVTHLVGLLQLNVHTCKWPIGDPVSPGFGFCGASPLEGKPYCKTHHRRAHIGS